ncbi:MAG: hypothetical protein NZ934_04075 [Hadesarchaea archaeon]|nr:hypothetical protein [Hadesarchaea archaeon]
MLRATDIQQGRRPLPDSEEGGSAYLVVMDKPGTRGAPGYFYAELRELDIRRIQRSVYLAPNQAMARRAAELGRRHGFLARVFKVIEEL